MTLPARKVPGARLSVFHQDLAAEADLPSEAIPACGVPKFLRPLLKVAPETRPVQCEWKPPAEGRFHALILVEGRWHAFHLHVIPYPEGEPDPAQVRDAMREFLADAIRSARPEKA